MKKTVLILTCILMFFCLASCGTNLKALDRKETYADFSGSLAEIYTSTDQLTQNADIIAEVTVTDQNIAFLDGLPRTHSQVRIENLLKGNAAEGDILTVIEEGCDTKEEKVIMGVPPMKTNQRYILFLTEYYDDYFILGAFQGKFIVKEGYVFQQSTKDVKMKSYSPITVEEFKNMFS